MSDIVTKPAVSQQQWKWMFATGQPFARRWANMTPGGKGKRFRRLPVKVVTKAQTPEEKAMFAKMGGSGGGGGGSGGSKLWSRGPSGKRQPTRAQAEHHLDRMIAHANERLRKAESDVKRTQGDYKASIKRANAAKEGTAEESQALRHNESAREKYSRAKVRQSRAVAQQNKLYDQGLKPYNIQTKAYDAKAGQQIAGRLYRGNDGKFTAGSADDQAKETIARNKRLNAAAPKGGKGKGKGKKGSKGKAAKPRKPVKTPEQRAQERATKKAQEQQANRNTVKQAMMQADAALSPTGFDSVMKLVSGQTLDAKTTSDLVQLGMLKRLSDGGTAMTSEARQFVRAANIGDSRGAIDAVNTAADSAKKRTAATKSFVLKDAGHTGVMLALFPPSEVTQALTQIQGVTEPGDQLHVTLTFLGDSTELPPDTREKLMSFLASFVENARPLVGEINGVGRFFNAESDNTNAVYAAVDIPDLPTFRQSLIEGLKAAGIPVVENHGYTPHMTLAYVPQDAPTPDIRFTAIPVQFDAVTLAWGDEHTTYSTGYATKSFTVYKSVSGQYRWLSVTTTAFEDLDGEIITKAALADEVRRTGTTGDLGPLRWWHVGIPDGPGLDIGRCDLRMLSPSGLSLIESGTFADEQTAHAVATKADQYEVSPGFRCRPQERGRGKAYSTIRIFERSLVPRWAGRASNRLTTFTV